MILSNLGGCGSRSKKSRLQLTASLLNGSRPNRRSFRWWIVHMRGHHQYQLRGRRARSKLKLSSRTMSPIVLICRVHPLFQVTLSYLLWARNTKTRTSMKTQSSLEIHLEQVKIHYAESVWVRSMIWRQIHSCLPANVLVPWSSSTWTACKSG